MNLAKLIDHTILKPIAQRADIERVCAEARKYGFCSVCINPVWVAYAKQLLKGSDVKVCTVIGFPNGYNTTAVKAAETAEAVKEGASEIDMVINIGWVRDGRYDLVLDEINAVKAACGGRILKVIIETCLLTEEEKIRMCEVVTESEADFIKTSTGFSTAGATFEDVALMKAHMGEGKKIKAAGGIADFHDAVKFVTLGADRLGTSRLAEQAKRGGADLDAEI